MHSFTSLVLALAATNALAAPTANANINEKRMAQFAGTPLQITGLKVTDSSAGNSTLAFTVHDPDPLTNATTACSGAWAHGSNGYPQGGYLACADSSFGWNIYSYSSITNFTVRISHFFKDPSIGQPPYDYVTTFSRAPIDNSVLACDIFGGDLTCNQNVAVISAKIFATAA